MKRYTINVQGLVRVNPRVYSMENLRRGRFYFPSFLSYNLINAFLIKQKHRNVRVCLHLSHQKKKELQKLILNMTLEGSLFL